MLKKPSPLKHKEEGHMLLTETAHKEAHGGEIPGEGIVDDHEVGSTFKSEKGGVYNKKDDGWYKIEKDGEETRVDQNMFKEHHLKGIKPVVKEDDKEPEFKSLSFNDWYTNEGGEKSMVERLQGVHGTDEFEFTQETAGDDVVGIKRKSDGEFIKVRLETSWTDNADHSSGYKKYLEFVGGENADEVLTNYHNKTINAYKLTNNDGVITETDKEFYERTKPTAGAVTAGATPRDRISINYTEIAGIRKTGIGQYNYNPASGKQGPVSQADKVAWEKINFLHTIKNKADVIDDRGLLSEEEKNKPTILKVADNTNKKIDKTLTTDVGDKHMIPTKTGDDKTEYNVGDYTDWMSTEQAEDVQERLLNLYANARVQHSDKLDKAINDYLPGVREEADDYFSSRVTSLEEESQKIIKNVSPGVQQFLRKEIEAGLWDGKSQEEINAEYRKRLNRHLEVMQPKYNALNKDYKTYVNNSLKKAGEEKVKNPNYDPKKPEGPDNQKLIPGNPIGGILEDISVEAANAWEQIEDDFYKNWAPEPNLISGEIYEGINKKLDAGGFTNMDAKDKKLALTKQWNELEAGFERGGMSKEDIAKREKEFWGINYHRLAKNKDGRFTQFLMKDFAREKLGEFEDIINLTIDEQGFTEKQVKIGQEAGKPIYSVQSPRQQAIAYLRTDPRFKGYQQANRMIRKIIDAPESVSNSGFVNFWRGFTSREGHEYIPFIQGIVNTADSKKIKNITDKDPKDRTPAEETLLTLHAMKMESQERVSGLSNSYSAGQMTADMVPFMGEMIATSGAASLTQKAVSSTIRGKMLTKTMYKTGTLKIADRTANTIGYLAGAGSRTALSPQRYLDNTFQNMTSQMQLALSTEGDGFVAQVDENSGENFLPAFARGFGTTYSEFMTEGLGEKIPGLSRWFQKSILKDPDWLKKVSLGHYMRKLGLDRTAAQLHFMRKGVMWNGVLGEMGEEIINQPIQNVINGVGRDGWDGDIFDGMTPWHSDPEKAKKGRDFYETLAISMSATGFVFRGGTAAYNKTRGSKTPSYYVDGRRLDTKEEALNEYNRLFAAGKINANTDVEVNNDWETFDELSNLVEEHGFKGLVKSQSGTSKAIEDKITATEIEVMNEIESNPDVLKVKETKTKLENLENELNELQDQKVSVEQNPSRNKEEQKEKLRELDQKINIANSKRKSIVDPIIEKIEKKKTYNLYKQNLKSAQKRAEQLYGKEMPIIEVNNETQARQEIENEFKEQIDKAKAKEDTNRVKELEQLRKETLGAFQRSHGFITPDFGNGQRIIVNKGFSLQTRAVNVTAHELLHRILQTTVRQNPETSIALGESLGVYLKNLDPKQFRNSELRQRLRRYQTGSGTMEKFMKLEAMENKESPEYKALEKELKAYQVNDAMTAGEETLNLLSDALASGDLQYNENLLTKIGDSIRRAMSAMGIKTKFNDARDVFNFIKDYNNNIAKGKAFDRGMLKTMLDERGVNIGGQLKEGVAYTKKQLSEFAPGLRYDPSDGSFYFSKEMAGDKVTEADIEDIATNPETGRRYTNAEWEREGVNDAFMQLVYGDKLNGLIRNIGEKIQGDNVFGFPINDFFTEVKEGLNTAILNFKPEQNDNFSGWIGFHVAKKKPGVLADFKKRSEIKKGKPGPTPDTAPEREGGVMVNEVFGVTDKVNNIVKKNYTRIKPKGSKLKYKDVKGAIVSIEDIINPKTGKLKKPTKIADVKFTGPLWEVIKVYAKEFGIPAEKIVAGIALTKTERRNAQQKIANLGMRRFLDLMPEGYDSDLEATGMPTSILNAVDPETGETNLLYTKIGRKKNLDLQKKNNLNSINLAAAANVFGITPIGEMNRFDTENRLVDGPIRGAIIQLAALGTNQSITEIAEQEGNLAKFASIKDGKGDLAYSLPSIEKDKNLDRQLDFQNGLDNVMARLKPGFGKNVLLEKIIKELQKEYGDLYSQKEYKNIAKDMKAIFDKYQPKTILSPEMKEEAWTEMVTEMEELKLDNFLKFLGINKKATEIFDDEVNINRMRQTVPALGNWMLEQGFSHDKIAEVMLALQPAYAGNSQMSRKYNFKEDAAGYAVKISDDIRTKKQGGTMSSPRNQSFPKVDSYVDYGVMAIDGMKESGAWERAKEKTKLRRQSAVDALKNVDASGNTTLGAEIKADAELARTAIDFMMDFLIASPNHDVLDIGMFLVSNLSHMEAPIRRAAMFSDVVEGITDPNHKNYIPAGTASPKEVAAWMKKNGIKDHSKVAEIKPFKTVKKIVKGKKVSVKVPNKIPYRNKYTVVYEHSIPASDMAYRVAYYKINNKWDNDFWDKYTVAVITKEMDDILKANGLLDRSNPGFVFLDPDSSQYDRYYGPLNFGENMLPIRNIFTGKLTGEGFSEIGEDIPNKKQYDLEQGLGRVQQMARTGYRMSKEARGMSTFDFDETLIIEGENFITAIEPNTGKKVRISSANWPVEGPKFAEMGYTFDFSDFVNVRGGVQGPLLKKMKNQIRKYGPKNVFVLTARPAESATAIYGWLKSQGITIPFENITGLGNSTGEAKAEWMLGKFAEGYNDMYFVDDALSNVDAVKKVLDNLDIKSKVVQAKIKFSLDVGGEFNKILETNTGFKAEATISSAKAKLRGRKIGRFKFFIPPSAEDMKGLIYHFLGKGKEGDKQMEFFKKALLDPFARGYRELNAAKQTIANDYRALRKKMPDVRKKLNKKIPDLKDYTYDNAVRVYLWDKAGFETPGISAKDKTKLIDTIKNDSKLKSYADAIGLISKRPEGYVPPSEHWLTGNVLSDLDDATRKIGRKEFLAEWIENKNKIFSPENLNKIEAIYGTNFREALEDMLYRMENGTNRSQGMNKLTNQFMNWTNNSVGAIMFFNARSAVLQTLSTVNFINWETITLLTLVRLLLIKNNFGKILHFYLILTC